MAKKVTKSKQSSKKNAKPVVMAPMPSYLGFSKQVFTVLNQSQKLFLRLVGLMSAVVFVLTISSQQTSYFEQAAGLQIASSEVATGLVARLLETGVLFVTVISGTLTNALTDGQQFSLGLIYMLAWLVMVWLLRHLIVNKTVSLRDGIYSAGAPIVPTILVTLVALAQLIPLALLVALVTAVSATGVANEILIVIGVILALVLAVVTLYWLIGTLFAAIIVTIPGTYPVAALRSARGIVAGYRATILKRILFLGLLNFLVTLVILLPILFIDSLSGYVLSWLTVTIIIVLTVSLFLYSSAYIYLLYRRIIDERSQ